MRNISIVFCALLFCITLKAQVAVNNTNTVASYVQNVLLGGGITVSNITFNGAPASVVNTQVGEFTDPTSSIGLPAGMILGSGNVMLAQQPNTGGSSSLGGTGTSGTDPDLLAINAPSNIFDEAVLEFDFIPTGDTLRFNYVFASEEYEEYVCATVNDAFGFFLTGNNPLGGTYNSQNIALVPNPLVPGTFTTTPVTINTINPGVAGAFGNAATCATLDPNWASYNVFYQSNTGGTSYEYDGRTVVLPIEALVNCGETYHIKIAISINSKVNPFRYFKKYLRQGYYPFYRENIIAIVFVLKVISGILTVPRAPIDYTISIIDNFSCHIFSLFCFLFN